MITIGLLGTSLIEWRGGIDLLIYLANALSTIRTNVSIILFVPKNQITFVNYIKKLKHQLHLLLETKKIHTLSFNSINYNEIKKAFKNLDTQIKIVLFDNSHKGLKKALLSNYVDLILPSIVPLPDSFIIPWVGYITDLQHKHFPMNFPKIESSARDKTFSTILKNANTVIVNSKYVKNDINNYYPGFADKIFSLPFAPYPDSKWIQTDSITLPYVNISQRYFIISNQFWTHKSHITAFKALAMLHKNSKFADVQIVCTGNQHDKRCPNYFSILLNEIKKMGIDKKIVFLGLIPKPHQIQLMKSSIAVVQPTLFEGGPGGGSVYNAIALGIPAIVSDIQINKEIHEPNVSFFEAGNEIDLAQKMEKILLSPYQKPTINQLSKKGDLRLKLLSDTLSHIIDITLRNYNFGNINS